MLMEERKERNGSGKNLKTKANGANGLNGLEPKDENGEAEGDQARARENIDPKSILEPL